MALKDLLKKKDNIKEASPDTIASLPEAPKPEFTFVRSDTNSQEFISPPSFPDDPSTNSEKHHTSPFFRLRASSNASSSPRSSTESKEQPRPSSKDKDSRRLSQRLHLSRSNPHSLNQTSTNVPSDLPDIAPISLQSEEEKQAAWEERATLLAKENPNTDRRSLSRGSTTSTRSRRSETTITSQPNFHHAHLGDNPARATVISDAKSDDDIQVALQLHEAGNLSESTAMFGRLASKNAMAQILYGLALRHGWGIDADPALGITYLSRAAQNSASVEADARHNGVKKGGAAKGDLVLAIYELANSFRHGWGVERDPVAARKYYEVAANLGDTDAMNEAGRCWEDGYGGKKDRVSDLSFLFLFLWEREESLCWEWTYGFAESDA